MTEIEEPEWREVGDRERLRGHEPEWFKELREQHDREQSEEEDRRD